ncbi:MAG: TPM domain-containing protein [Phycisphaerales bacterium]|nr:TPM domain-containing protein [Phycisphaerales bacterium]
MKARLYTSIFLLTGVVLASVARAAEVMPPPPQRYFNDYANVVSPAVAQQLNAQLEQFERDTSNQLRVVIYPKMQSDSSIEDYTVRVAQSWRIGMKGKDNGAILFVFVQDRTLHIQVGYGLEGALPDATTKSIIDEQITPHLKAGDFNTAMRAGVASMIAATKGEYKGTGQTALEQQQQNPSGSWLPLLLFGGIFILPLIFRRRGGGGIVYSGGGWGGIGGFPIGWGGMGRMGRGGWGGGMGGMGGGGFSRGGGGTFGGGGAGGRW